VLERRAVYRDAPGEYADIWAAIRARFGETVEAPRRSE
jgi:hypothetical protein